MVGLFDCLGLFALGLIGLVVFIALIVVYNDIAIRRMQLRLTSMKSNDCVPR